MPSTLFQNLYFLYIYPFKAVKIVLIHIDNMKEEGKSYYEAPATTVVAVKTGGVVCQSLDGIESAREGYGTVLEDTWV